MATHSRKPLFNLAARITDTPLAVHPGKLQAILRAVGPRLGLAPRAHGEDDLLDDVFDAAEERAREPGSVAVLPIVGSLVSRGMALDALSGLASYPAISAELAELLEDDDVDGILLEVDSFGGECQGLFDLVDQIRAARDVKPVWAVASENAYSAGYAIASAAEKLFVPRTGGVGSIGVVAVHADQSGFDRDLGVKVEFLHAGKKKVDGNPHEPLNDRARTDIQAEVDRIYGIFLESVAADGRLTAEQARATEAGTFHGAEAVKAGLVDEVGTLADALTQMQSELATESDESPFGAMPTFPRSATHAA